MDALCLRSYSVGVTTLEEVFLKIGHGEEVEQAREENNMNLKAQGEKLANVKPEDQELEDYSIAVFQESGFSSFANQFLNLAKSKLLRQFRDKQILAIEILFPIILLIFMFSASSINFQNQNGVFTCDVGLFPKQDKYYNLYFYLNGDADSTYLQPATFADFTMNNQSFWMNSRSLGARTEDFGTN